MPNFSRTLKIPGKTSEELYAKLSAELEHFMAKASFGKIEISRDATLKQIGIKASLFKAHLTCEEEALRVEAELSLMAAPFRKKIDEVIDRWISQNFPESS
jgi:hypothetical protein